MFIGHVITTIDLGGAEKQLLTLSTKQVQEGHTVCVLPLKGKLELIDEFLAAGVIVDTNLFSNTPLIQALKLKQKIKRFKIDVLHAHLPRAELICRVAVNPKTKFGITRHNAEHFLPDGPRIFSNLLSRWVLSRTDFQIAISQAVHDFIRTSGDSRSLQEFELVYYGAERDSDFRFRVQAKKKLSLVCIARFVQQKNHELLINVLSSFPNRDNLNLTLIGRGPEKENLLSLSSNLNVLHLLRWKSIVRDVKEEIRKYEFLVLPSRYEGFGLVLLEAMEIGLPIIASDCGAIVEVLGPGYVGLFENGNKQSLEKAIERFCDDAVRAHASDYLFERFELFNTELLYEKTLSVYNRALEDL